MTGQPQFCRRIFKCSKDPSIGDLNFYVPAELLVPCDTDDICVVDFFKNNLLEICASRNNNVELQVSANVNQLGYFTDLQELMRTHNSALCDRIEWKPNDGGDIKVQDIVALAWIPLNLITPMEE